MKLQMTNSRWAALSYAIAALAPIGSWIILLFVAIPEKQTFIGNATSTISFIFSSENRWWFIGWTALPLFLLTLAVAYLSSFASHREGRRLLFIAAIFPAIFSLFLAPPLGFVLLATLYLSFKAIKNA